MLRLLGLIFISLIISVAIVLVDIILPGNFLNSFMGGDFIQTFATIFGFNIAAIIFLLGQLFVIERTNQNDFPETRKEIKHNAYYLLISFFTTIILFTIRPDFIKEAIKWNDNFIFYLINVVVLTLFIIAIYAIIQVLEAAFMLKKK